MRICIIYDCLYPWTVGGAERWLRGLAETFASAGHSVTYLTRLQWPDDAPPQVNGVEIVAVAARDSLYKRSGSRRMLPPLKFGLGVFLHLIRHRREYDVLHLCSFPYFALLGARAAMLGSRVRIGVDWFEVWSRAYWNQYLGSLGFVGYRIQRFCIRLTPLAFVFSRLHGERLIAEGFRGIAVRLSGLYQDSRGGKKETTDQAAIDEMVLYVGRHIPEKNVPSLVQAIVEARKVHPRLKGRILGDGPTRREVLESIQREDATQYIDAPGFIEISAVEQATRTASCLVLPSSREGYGLVVIEACAAGTPVVVVAGADNAAAELVEEGVNGYVAVSAEPGVLAEAIGRCIESGERLRTSTRHWFEANAHRLSSRESAQRVLDQYSQ